MYTQASNSALTDKDSEAKPWLKYYTKEQIDLPLPELKAYNYMFQKNETNIERTALNYYDTRISFKNLFSHIEEAASAFSSIGIKENDIVAIISVTLPETIYCFYGLNRIGAISNMIDPRTSIEGIRNYINEVAAETIVVLDLAYSRILQAIEGTNVKNIIVISPSDSLPILLKTLYKLKNSIRFQQSSHLNWKSFIKKGKNHPFVDTVYKKDTCCTIVHTGGTTGMPKSVMLSNDNINAAAQQILESPLPLSVGDVFLNIMPPFIAYGTVLGIHTVSVGGLESVLIPKFDPTEFDGLLLKYRPQCVMGVPTHFEVVMKSKKLIRTDLSFLKVAFVGGDKIKEEAEKKINSFFSDHNCNIKISKGYSLTEASATATFASKDCNKVGSVGSPLSKTIVAAFDSFPSEKKAYGELGKIYISSPTLMLGYFGNKKATDDIIKTDDNGCRWLFTGDLGYVDEDGCVFILGREKRMIIRHDGFKVFPSLVESVIEKCEEIKECCVVGADDRDYSQGQLPIAFVTLNDGIIESNSLTNKIKQNCEKELPEYSQPIDVIYIKKMPLTPIGKIDYNSLEKSLQD